MKQCITCKHTFSLETFNHSKRSKDGHESICRSCAKIKRQSIRLGITPEIFKTLSNISQCCEICGSKKRLVFDHDHSDGQFRGILCYFCNRGLSYFRDNPKCFDNAASYLRKPKIGSKW